MGAGVFGQQFILLKNRTYFTKIWKKKESVIKNEIVCFVSFVL